jgi:thiol-disulfide isomerase/thioredoxin
VQLSDFRGKAVLLNFWATWCPPCKVEIPWFVDLQNRYAGRGLQVVGIAMDDAGAASIARFANDMNMNYPVLQGTENVADSYGGVDGLPITFYIGRDGRVAQRILGLGSHADVEDAVRSVLHLGEGAATQTAAQVNR